MIKKTLRFFDKLEDRVRATLSQYPVIYSIIGGIAIVLFWRGVWHTADQIPFLTGPVSILLSIVVLLVTGLFASFFVGDQIIISGLKHDKKIIEKTETEEKTELTQLADVKTELKKIEDALGIIKEHEAREHGHELEKPQNQ